MAVGRVTSPQRKQGFPIRPCLRCGLVRKRLHKTDICETLALPPETVGHRGKLQRIGNCLF